MENNTVYVIIPAYEPDNTLLNVINDLHNAINCDIIVVNDGSGKDKDKIFNEAVSHATILTHSQNKGKGEAIKTALKYISENGDKDFKIVIADADGQHKTEDILKIIDALNCHNNSLILGCRKFSGKIPLRSKIGNKITSFVFSFAADVKVSDTQTGLRGFSDKLLPYMLKISGSRYEYEMNMLLDCAKDKIPFFEVPIETIYIEENKSSHFNPIKDSWRIYKDILKFSCSSILSFCVDYIMYMLFLLISGRNLVFSNIAARIVSSCFNFSMNKKYVFKDDSSIKAAAVKYFLLAAGILLANTILLKLCFTYLIHSELVSKVIIEILLFFISWTVQKSFVFNKHKKEKSQ